MNRMLLLVVLIGCGRVEAQRPTCPVLEISVVADTPGDRTRTVTLPDGRKLFLSDTPLLTSADVTGAHASLTEGQYVLNVDVTSEGAKRIQLFSEQNVGRTVAFVVDGQVLRTPKIQDPIVGRGILVGGFQQAEAERLANAFNTGCRQ